MPLKPRTTLGEKNTDIWGHICGTRSEVSDRSCVACLDRLANTVPLVGCMFGGRAQGCARSDKERHPTANMTCVA